MTALLELVGVTREQAGRKLVDDLSLTVEEGELLVLVGASGSGQDNDAEDDQSARRANEWRGTHWGTAP